MPADVTPALERAHALFYRGRYSDFLSAFAEYRAAGVHSPATTLLASVALARRGQAREAIEFLRLIEDPNEYGLEVAIESLLLQSWAELVDRNPERATARVERAVALSAGVGDTEIACRIALCRALHAWTERDIARAEALAHVAMSSTKGATFGPAAQLLGFAAASCGRYMEQIAILEATLAQLDRCRHTDMWLEASLLQNISGVVADFALPAVARRLSERTQSIDWSEETAVPLYHILRSLSYARVYGSDPSAPLEYLERAENVVPSDAWRLLALLDRILLGTELGARRRADGFDVANALREARELAERVDWPQMRGEECVGLLTLADLLAPECPQDAARYLARFRALKENLSRSLMAHSDARWSAAENYVEGVIAASLDPARGVAPIAEAFAFWENVGYSWRATRAALKLHELTGERRYLDWADRESRLYPFSWIGDAVTRARGRRLAPLAGSGARRRSDEA